MKFTARELRKIILEEIQKALEDENLEEAHKEEHDDDKEEKGGEETSQKAEKSSKEQAEWDRVYGHGKQHRGGYRGKDYSFHGSGPRKGGRRMSDADILRGYRK